VNTLSKPQQKTLLAEALKISGTRPGFPEFADAVLQLLEDIPGFESPSDLEVSTLLVQLMRLYRDQHSSPRKNRYR
jgi:hypothetical protein